MKIKLSKALVFAVIVLFIGASVAPSISSDNPSFGNTIYVDDDADPGWYDATHVKTIQEGIDNATDGDTVYVYNGTYYENLIISKTIDLIGENQEGTIIKNTNDIEAIYVSADNTLISHITVNNTGSNGCGINVFQCSGCKIYNNRILLCYGHPGIIVKQSENTIILNNSVSLSGSGVSITSGDNNIVAANELFSNSYGIHYNKASSINIYDNMILNNTYEGIYMDESNQTDIYNNTIIQNRRGIYIHNDCWFNQIYSNIIDFNDYGVLLHSANNNSVYSNDITNNTYYGIRALNYGNIPAENNSIYHNNFINNTQNAYDECANTWYNATLQEGNYWDDYTGTDADGDGIGDIPYDIPGGSNQDLYPLGYFVSTPDTVYIDDDYTPSTPGWGYDHFDVIQDGIDAVAENGMVYVYNGTYYENVVVDKTINLTGEDRDTTIIDGGGSGDVVYVSADEVELKGFKILNGTSSGILLSYCNDCLIHENIIDAKSLYFGTAGMRVVYSHDNVIKENIFIDNYQGLIVAYSSNNLIYHNNFINTAYQPAYDGNGYNFWDNGYPTGGNFWEEYAGNDSFHGPNQDIDGYDGIGDTPFPIPDEGFVFDNYPFMNPSGWLNNPPTADADGAYYANITNDFTVTLNGSGSYDSDGIITNYTWDFGDGDIGYGENPTHRYIPQEEQAYQATVTLTVRDDDGATDTDTAIVYVGTYNDPPLIQLIYPTGGEILSGTTTVRWYAIDGDFPGESLPIYLYYRPNDGDTWRRINDVLPNTGEYQWDTGSLSDGQYRLLVEAVDSHGNIAHESSDPFTIDNGYAGVRVSDIHIQDTSTGSTNWVKNGDTVEITAGITGSISIEREDITADLSGFGRGTVIADSYDGFTATWTLYNVQCTPSDGTITVTVTASDIDSNSAIITADNTDPELKIYKPTNGLYFFNGRLLPLKRTIIIGAITIELDTDDTSGIERAEFYIDNKMEKTVTKEPFEWYTKLPRWRHRLEVIVYDHAGNKAAQSVDILKFL